MSGGLSRKRKRPALPYCPAEAEPSIQLFKEGNVRIIPSSAARGRKRKGGGGREGKRKPCTLPLTGSHLGKKRGNLSHEG